MRSLCPGHPGGPIAVLLDLADRVLPDVASLRRRAIALFDEFVRPEAFSEQNCWHFEVWIQDIRHVMRPAASG